MTWREFTIVALSGLMILPVACANRTPSLTTFPAEAQDEDGPALFRYITATSGIRFIYRNGAEAGHLSILESLGGGVALLDFDHDGKLDIFPPGGGSFEGKEIRGRPCKLYRQVPTRSVGTRILQFEDASDRLHIDGDWFYNHGAAVGDYDRDGWPDLLLTGWDRLALLHNEPVDPTDAGKGQQFVDVTGKSGLLSRSWSSIAGWADFDGDGYPDLYVCHYVNWSFANHPRCGRPADICPPMVFEGLPHQLFRNNRDGTFTDVSRDAPLRPGGPAAWASISHRSLPEPRASRGVPTTAESR